MGVGRKVRRFVFGSRKGSASLRRANILEKIDARRGKLASQNNELVHEIVDLRAKLMSLNKEITRIIEARKLHAKVDAQSALRYNSDLLADLNRQKAAATADLQKKEVLSEKLLTNLAVLNSRAKKLYK